MAQESEAIPIIIGATYSLSNFASEEPRTPGLAQLTIRKYSRRLFWIGEPVRAILRFVRITDSALKISLEVFVSIK
jgi:hypothetical protein